MKISEAIDILNKRIKPGTAFFIGVNVWKFAHTVDPEPNYNVYLGSATETFASDTSLQDAMDKALRWLDEQDGTAMPASIAEADALMQEADEMAASSIVQGELATQEEEPGPVEVPCEGRLGREVPSYLRKDQEADCPAETDKADGLAWDLDELGKHIHLRPDDGAAQGKTEA